ncbi:MAG: ABC-F family ATP-binding cassette domain-containing protein, partial [Planctomycetaceae bacterium]
MILLSARDLSRQFGAQPVFRHVEFDVRAGEKIGLVGPNGSGKTTLLNILAGRDDADEGAVELRPSCDIVLLEQQPDFPPGQTLIDEARLGLDHLYRLQREAVELAELIANETEGDDLRRHQRRYDQIQHELERHDAYHVEHRVEEVLTGLGFAEQDYGRPLVQFSGGQQNRALLARMLLHEPDLMLLDEPTNHLDISATEWLEGYLLKSRQAMLVVSHDRYFLDRVTNRTLEIVQGKVTSYSGNFSAYRKQREERDKVLRRTYERQQEFVAKTEDFIRRNKYGQKSNQAHDREKKLSRLEEVERPREEAAPAMHFGEAARAGDWVIDAVGLWKGFGTPLICDFTLRIARGDRVGILGPNGSGKTTLLRTLIGDLQPDRGSVRLGTGVEIGYFDQQLNSVPADATAIDAVRPPGDMSFTPAVARHHLARFGVRGETALQTVAQMSGGEKSKVALARLAALDVNLLVLDEPTNHLDLWARESLEEALKEFEGTLLFVSHDRYFIDRVAEHVIVLEDDGWRYHAG